MHTICEPSRKPINAAIGTKGPFRHGLILGAACSIYVISMFGCVSLSTRQSQIYLSEEGLVIKEWEEYTEITARGSPMTGITSMNRLDFTIQNKKRNCEESIFGDKLVIKERDLNCDGYPEYVETIFPDGVVITESLSETTIFNPQTGMTTRCEDEL